MPDPARTVRVPDLLWDANLNETAKQGESISDVVRRALALNVDPVMVAARERAAEKHESVDYVVRRALERYARRS